MVLRWKGKNKMSQKVVKYEETYFSKKKRKEKKNKQTNKMFLKK